MNPKRALLITGEIRSDQTLLEGLHGADRSSVQPIFSVWDKVGIKLGGWIGPWQIWRVLGSAAADSFPTPLIGFGGLEGLIPDFFERLRGDLKTPVDREMLRAITPCVDIEDQRLFVEVLPKEDRCCNARILHYKMARAFLMMELEEQRVGYRFETVLRIRPDLVALPDLDVEVAPDEIVLDWVRFDGVDGACVAGDNAILLHRDVFAEFLEFLRVKIYDEYRGNIHDLIGSFVDTRGLKAREMSAGIAEGRWPLPPFLRAMEDKAESDPRAREFMLCFRAWELMARGELGAVEAVLDQVQNPRSPAVLLCRGALAIRKGDGARADAMSAELAACFAKGVMEADYYSYRMEQLRTEAVEAERCGAAV